MTDKIFIIFLIIGTFAIGFGIGNLNYDNIVIFAKYDMKSIIDDEKYKASVYTDCDKIKINLNIYERNLSYENPKNTEDVNYWESHVKV